MNEEEKKVRVVEWRRGNHLDKLLSVLAVTGEIGYRSLDMLGGRDIYRQTVKNGKNIVCVRNVYTGEEVKSKLFTVSGTGELKRVRLSKKAKSVLAWKDEEEPYAITLEREMTSDKQKIERRQRIAETLAVMEKLEIPYWKNRLMPFGRSGAEAKPIGSPMFYSSLDLKSDFVLSTEDKRGLDKSRMVGWLVSEAGVYPVYNIKNGIRKWNPSGELDMRMLCEKYEANTFETFHTKYRRANEKSSCILLCNTYESGLNTMLLKRLEIQQGESEEEVMKKLKQKNRYAIEFGKVFGSVHCVTLDEGGRDILRILTVAKHRPTILKGLFGDKWVGINAATSFTYDAETVDGGRAITLADGDIGRFNKFVIYATDNPTAHKYHVYCYPEQVNFVIGQLGTLAKIHILNIQEIFDSLGLGTAETAADEQYIMGWQKYANKKTDKN